MTTAAGPALGDPLAELNPQQRAAAAAVHGPVCILAGAGTGKTRTITHRIAAQISSGTARADQILAVTFTDKAAAELRARLAALGVPPVRAATFHAAAWAQLRHFWPRMAPDRPRPQVLASKLRLLMLPARRLGVEARDLAAEIEWAKARRLSPEEYAGAAADRSAPLPAMQMADVYRRYEEEKAKQAAIDYEDMLLQTTALLDADPVVAAQVRDRYRFFTVDEYQDVNDAQHALLRAWLGDRDDVCVVGDDDQTIYSFTGASSRHLINFPREFAGATQVTLSINYRSTGAVLNLANRVLWTKPPERRKRLAPARRDAAAPAPRFCEYADADAEVAAVTQRCRELVAAGTPPGEIAVLYRVNAQSEGFEAALRDAGLPYAVRGDGGFFTRSEVRQALRLLVADRDRGPQRDPADLLDTVAPAAEAVDRRVERVLRDGLRWNSRREPPGALARERWRNIGTLAAFASRRVTEEPQVSYETVVDDLVERAAGNGEAPDPDGAITLATLHRAKGLEFDAVFLVSCEEGLLPISHARSDEEVEEERRLLYVGVTRARRHLELSWARSRPGRSGRLQPRRPSRLLYGLGEGAPRAGDTRRPPDRAARAPRTPPVALAELDAEAAAVAETLRQWRRERAQRDEVPAFVVCSDRTLAALATASPSNRKELLQVHGFGPAKVSRYGDEVLDVLRRIVP